MMLDQGAQFPFEKLKNIVPAMAVAHATALGVFSDLGDRRGIRQELDECDRSTRREILRHAVDVIHAAPPGPAGAKAAVNAILADLQGRSGVGDQIETIAADVMKELKQSLVAIINQGRASTDARVVPGARE
jgi:hypothetical protein